MKCFYLAVLLLLSSVTNAQHKLKAKLQTGGNIAYQSGKSIDNFKNQPIVSYHLAALLEKPFSRGFAIETGVSFQGKGRHIDMDGLQDVEGSSTIRMMYLEIPVNALAKFPVSKTTKGFVGGGPYVSVGLGGKQDYGYSARKKIFNGIAGANGYRPTDWGLNLKTGIEINNIALFVQYGMGLQNIAPGPNMVIYDVMPGYQPPRPNIKNRVFSVGVGYSL